MEFGFKDASSQFKGMEPWMIAAQLANMAGRPVINKTGLKGLFEFRLEYSLKPSDDRPDISRAIQDQLGLKLESARGPVETIVIDHLENRPRISRKAHRLVLPYCRFRHKKRQHRRGGY